MTSRIVVGYVPNPLGDAAIAAAIDEARRRDGELVVINTTRADRLVNPAYADDADPAVVAPARRMLAAGLDGDLDKAAVATEEAAATCRRLGFPMSLPTSGSGLGVPGRDRPCGVVSC